jgi:spore maturation protein CgeB
MIDHLALDMMNEPAPEPSTPREGDFAVNCVVVTSTIVDRLNTNARIRGYLSDAFAGLLGSHRVASCPLERAPAYLEQLRPSLVVAVGSLASDTSDLRRLRQSADRTGGLIAYWLHDDPYEFDYAFKAELYADTVFSNDAWSVIHYRHPNVHHLPMAAAPGVHWRRLVPVAQRDLALFFCGVAFPNRIEILSRADDLLSRYPVRVLGDGWPSEIRCARNRRLSSIEMGDYAQNAKLTLNLGRDLNIANLRYALPASTPGPRTFEIAMAGSAQLYFASGLEILDYFEPEKEIILFDEIGDIKRTIEQAYDDPESIDLIAKNAQQRALYEHSYLSRARRILSICSMPA